MFGRCITLCTKIWRILPRSFQYADFQSIFAHSASAVTPSEKVQLTLIGTSLNTFQCTGVRRLAVAETVRLLLLDI